MSTRDNTVYPVQDTEKSFQRIIKQDRREHAWEVENLIFFSSYSIKSVFKKELVEKNVFSLIVR